MLCFRDKILTYHDQFVNLTRMKSLNWSSTKDGLTTKESEFIESSQKLLDISCKNIEDKIRADRFSSSDAKLEDIQFIADQRNERKMIISEENDESYLNSLRDKKLRPEKMEEMLSKLRVQKEASTVINPGETEVSSDASKEEEDEFEDSDKEFRPQTSYKKRTGQVIELTPYEFIEATSTVAARFKVGIRPQTAMLSAILNKSGVDLNETSISRASVHRKRFQVLDRQRDKMRQ